MATNKSFGKNLHKGTINPPSQGAGHQASESHPPVQTHPSNGGGSPKRPITHTKRGSQ